MRTRRRWRARNRRVVRLRDRLHDAGAVAAGARRALRRALPALIAVTGVALVVGAGWLGYRWLTTSDRFAVRAIEVRGTARLSAEHVRGVAGVAPGDNVFLVDLSAVERRVAGDPWVDSAHAERELPDRLVIDIVERQPAALVELGGLYLADATGLVFKRAEIERGEGAVLPIVTGIARKDYLSDEPTARAAIRRALAIARTYAARGARPALGEIHVDPQRGVTLITYETALAVRLGMTSQSELSERLAAFDAAWSALDEDERDAAKVVYMDNETNPDRITVRFGGKH